MIGTDDEQHYWDCHDAAAEIERLHGEVHAIREAMPPPLLTDAEREAIVWCLEMVQTTATECDAELAALRGLLERTR
jgi:hypothetical protein